MFFESLFF